MKKIWLLFLFPILFTGSRLPAQILTTGLYLDSGSFTLKNSNDLTLLSGGIGTVVGDGDVVQFGYYTNATAGNLFAGTWVALTGNGGANSAFATTSIGDNPDAVGAGNTDGTFAFSASGSTPGDTYITFTQGSSTSGVSLPASGQIMAVRFYNGTTVSNSTYYGAVSDASWAWIGPTSPTPVPPMQFSLDDPVTWFNNQISYTGTALVVPEPSNVALFSLALAVLGFICLRRHRV